MHLCRRCLSPRVGSQRHCGTSGDAGKDELVSKASRQEKNCARPLTANDWWIHYLCHSVYERPTKACLQAKDTSKYFLGKILHFCSVHKSRVGIGGRNDLVVTGINCLPLTWLVFNSQNQHHCMWVKFIIWSHSCTKRFVSRFCGFTSSQKPTFPNPLQTG